MSDNKKKSDEVAERENEKFGLFIGKDVKEMRMELGSPKEDYIAENGNEILVYKTKKYGIPCERKFEVNSSGIIVAFSSSGCIWFFLLIKTVQFGLKNVINS